MNVDTRGSFTELLKSEKCGQVSINISKPGITKGEHWHNSKWEFFIVVSGHGLIQERKIGTDEKMIQKALFKQIALFFVAPLMVAIVHSVFGIQFCTYIISTFGKQNLLPSIIATVIFIILIYGGYMMVTYYSSRAMLKD